MNNPTLNLLFMIACAAAFGFFVPDAVIDAELASEGWRIPISIIGGGLIGWFWPRSKPQSAFTRQEVE